MSHKPDRHRLPVEVVAVKWMKTGNWVCRGVVCGMLCETQNPRPTKEEAYADAYEWSHKINSAGVKVVKV